MPWLDYTLLLISCVCALAGVISLGVAVWSIRWPTVTGTVDISITEPDLIGNQVTESHHLVYTYEVAGARYLGSHVKPWGNYDWSIGYGDDADGFFSGRTFWSRARDLSRWYRPGTVVKVYYCPLRPTWACLEPGGFFIPLVLAAVASFVFIALLP